MNRDHFWLTDAQFATIALHLPTNTRGKARVDDRLVISGIVHVLKSGGRWVDAPAVYGPRKTLYNRFVRWAAKGVWISLFQAPCSGWRPARSRVGPWISNPKGGAMYRTSHWEEDSPVGHLGRVS